MARSDGTSRGPRKAARGTRFARLGDVAIPALRGVALKRGMAEHRLIEAWPEIVGRDIARHCHPVRLSPPRGKGLGGTLVVSAPGPLVPEVTHMADQIVERVNAVHGHRAVSRLRVETSWAAEGMLSEPAAGFAHDGPPDPAPPSDHVATVADEGLRAALARLEKNIRRRQVGPDKQPKP
jgi:hypothetical protein